MTWPQQHRDPALQWSGHLGRLEGIRRDGVIAALRHSADAGWPASGEAVELLVSYALGEITARDYAAGILAALSRQDGRIAPLDPPPAATSGDVADEIEALPVRDVVGEPGPVISREDAVQAYVTGRIAVAEFLRLARS